MRILNKVLLPNNSVKVRTILLVIVLLCGNYIFSSSTGTLQTNPENLISEAPLIIQNLIDHQYKDPLVREFIDTGSFPENVEDNGILIVSHAPLDYLDNIIPPLKIKGTYLYITQIYEQSKMKKLNLDPNVKSILPNYLVNYTSAITPEVGLGTQSFLAKEILQTTDVWDDFGIDGDGVTIGVIDSGVDFGISDLSGAAHLTSTGITSSFDPTGAGLGLSNTTLQAVQTVEGTVLPLSTQNISIWLADELGYTRTDRIGLQLEDLRIDGITKPSVSGNYRVGIMFEPGYQKTILTQYFIFVLTDSVSSGIYDTLYVDLSTSLGISLARGGIIFETSQTYLSYVDWDLSDETPFGANSPIIARDFEGDGINDVSMGALSTTMDLYGVVNHNPLTEGINVKGIRSNGEGIAIMYDPIGHGTLVASAAAARGESEMLLFDDKKTRDVENDTGYYLPGSATGASIIATKGIAIDDFVLGWYWVAGFEVMVSNNQLVWTTNAASLNHRVDISSNSWGNGQIAFTGNVKGMDYYSLLLDAFATPNLLYDNYPGIIFVVASGNSGPGYGTVATPGTASMAITVGASSYYHFLDNNGKNDVAFFTSRGPTPYGGIKPDIVTPGNTGFTHYQVITGYGNGTKAAGTFGGTSEATPRASGVIALIIQALRQKGITPNLGNVRVALKSNAVDLGYSPTTQGAGLANAYNAVSAIINGDTPLFQTTETSKFIGERLNLAFGSLFIDENNQSLQHPLLQFPYPDTFLITNSTNVFNSQVLSVNYINGDSVDGLLLESHIDRMSLVESSKFEFSTQPQLTTTINLANLWNLSSSWRDHELLQISLSLSQSSWDTLRRYGLSTPDLILKDSNSGKIIYDLISQFTWTQQIYSGFPIEDFQGNPILELKDPGIENEISRWSGLMYNVTVLSYDYLPSNRLTAVPQSGGINITSNSLGEYEFNSLIVKYNDSREYNLPILFAEEEIVKFAENANIVSQALSAELPYDLNTFFGTLDWGYRPESGDFRFYYLHVPKNATFLAIHATWQVQGFIPDMYLFNESGVLVANSDVTYIGGGLYDSSTSEEFAQNLLIPTEGNHYTLMIHVTHMPFSSDPIELNLLTRYLTINTIPTPELIFQPTLDKPVSGKLKITSSDFDLSEFPEIHVNRISTQVLQGQNGSITKVIDANEIVISNSVVLSSVEDSHILAAEQGDKLHLILEWNANVDLDMYAFREGDSFVFVEDLLTQQGTSVGDKREEAFLSIDKTGNYIIYIDVAEGSDTSDIEFTLFWDSRDGPTIDSDGSEIEFDTAIFPNGEFELKITMFTNFKIQFTVFATLNLDNYINFTSSLLSPNSRRISGIVDTSWTSLRPVVADVILVIDQIEILISGSVKETQTNFDSRLYPNGEATLVVRLTDGVYIHIHRLSVVLDNDNPSSLPPEKKSDGNSLPSLSVIYLITTIYIILQIRNFRKRHSS